MDLTALRELAAWMKTEGASYARVGELELRLVPQQPLSPKGPPTPPMSGEHPAEGPAQDAGEDDDELRSLDELLYSSGGDPRSLNGMLRRARSAVKAV